LAGFVRVLATTGPWMLGDVVRSFFGVGDSPDAKFCGRPMEAHGVRAVAYPAGAWFTPCRPNDAACEM
jgi:hypothetical protein